MLRVVAVGYGQVGSCPACKGATIESQGGGGGLGGGVFVLK